jgi:hypothetical protein
MKFSLYSKVTAFVVAVLLTTAVFAAGAAHKGNLQVGNPVGVNGKQLPAGEYTVTWTGDGPDVTVNIARGSKVLATASAKVVALDKKADQDAAEVKNSSSGARELSVVRFSGQKYELELSAQTGQGSGKTGSSLK